MFELHLKFQREPDGGQGDGSRTFLGVVGGIVALAGVVAGFALSPMAGAALLVTLVALAGAVAWALRRE